MINIEPFKNEMFTWTEVSEPHILEVEIEGQHTEYNMDVIQDLNPFVLKN